MSKIRIEVFNGNYDNTDVYNRVLGYISNKTYIGGYGFNYDPQVPIIKQFQLSEQYSNHSSAQKMWHFIITFSDKWNHNELLWIAVQVACLFSSEYQILYGLDTDKGNPHLHFGVNVFSFYPDTPILSREKMYDYLLRIQSFLKKQYAGRTVTLQFQGKKV